MGDERDCAYALDQAERAVVAHLGRSRHRLPVEPERTQRMDHIAELPEAAPPRPLVAPISPRRGAANRIIALHGVSSFCYGLVFPFTGIFLADRPGIGTHGVALYYAVAGVANLAIALVLATGVVRPPSGTRGDRQPAVIRRLPPAAVGRLAVSGRPGRGRERRGAGMFPRGGDPDR